MVQSIDLNCDMGELQPHQNKNFDAEIMPFISSCNIACGAHSGSPKLIEQTIRYAQKHHVSIGAHPSYNDRQNFGRISLDVPLEDLLADLRYQICAVKGMAESFGARLSHVKPHGALYNDMATDTRLAEAFVLLVKSIDPQLRIFALAHTPFVDICQKHQMQAVQEGFVDRVYQSVHTLRSRKLQDAVKTRPQAVLKQVKGLLNGKITLWDKTIVPIAVDSMCLHSDTAGAVALSKEIHDFLKENNVNIAAHT